MQKICSTLDDGLCLISSYREDHRGNVYQTHRETEFLPFSYLHSVPAECSLLLLCLPLLACDLMPFKGVALSNIKLTRVIAVNQQAKPLLNTHTQLRPAVLPTIATTKPHAWFQVQFISVLTNDRTAVPPVVSASAMVQTRRECTDFMIITSCN